MYYNFQSVSSFSGRWCRSLACFLAGGRTWRTLSRCSTTWGIGTKVVSRPTKAMAQVWGVAALLEPQAASLAAAREQSWAGQRPDRHLVVRGSGWAQHRGAWTTSAG